MSYKDDKIRRLPKKPEPVARFAFFLNTAAVYYLRDGVLKERKINMLSQLGETATITKAHLADMQQKAMARVCTENGLELSAIKDVVFTNMSFLGAMTLEEFHGPSETAVDPAAPVDA